MSVNSGFDDLQTTVNASPESLKEARRRRDVFRAALGGAADIVEIIPTGSVARGTQRDPIHDVDLVAVFDAEAHDNWGTQGDSAEAALEHTRGRVKDLLGSSGSHSEEVRFSRLNNHSLKCFLDDPEDTDPFTVDVTPALRQAGGVLLIPERLNREWILSNPEHLNGEVARRHAEWNQFARLVRVLRRWNTDQGKVMKPLVIEVLALTHLPVDDRPQALKRFFAAARTAVLSPASVERFSRTSTVRRRAISWLRRPTSHGEPCTPTSRTRAPPQCASGTRCSVTSTQSPSAAARVAERQPQLQRRRLGWL